MSIGLFESKEEVLAEGAVLLRGFADSQALQIMDDLRVIMAAAPLRHMVTPGGFTMSVAMTNCGAAGWVTDRKGYRYTTHDPVTNLAWPAMPASFSELAVKAAIEAGYSSFHPDACLINRYEPGARMTLHQDKNEKDFDAPIVAADAHNILSLPAPPPPPERSALALPVTPPPPAPPPRQCISA